MIDAVFVLLVAGASAAAGFGVGALVMARRVPQTLARMTAQQLSAMATKVQTLRGSR